MIEWKPEWDGDRVRKKKMTYFFFSSLKFHPITLSNDVLLTAFLGDYLFTLKICNTHTHIPGEKYNENECCWLWISQQFCIFTDRAIDVKSGAC